MKKIMLLLTTCMLCVACQQHNNIEKSQLEGLWVVRRMSGGYTERQSTFYRFKPDGYNIISFHNSIAFNIHFFDSSTFFNNVTSTFSYAVDSINTG